MPFLPSKKVNHFQNGFRRLVPCGTAGRAHTFWLSRPLVLAMVNCFVGTIAALNTTLMDPAAWSIAITTIPSKTEFTAIRCPPSKAKAFQSLVKRLAFWFALGVLSFAFCKVYLTFAHLYFYSLASLVARCLQKKVNPSTQTGAPTKHNVQNSHDKHAIKIIYIYTLKYIYTYI